MSFFGPKHDCAGDAVGVGGDDVARFSEPETAERPFAVRMQSDDGDDGRDAHQQTWTATVPHPRRA